VLYYHMARKETDAGSVRRRRGELPRKQRVLFFCLCNSIRSQMAEGLLRAMRPDAYESFSAGLNPGKLSPEAVRVMAEVGIDISGQSPKGIEAFVGVRFDCVAIVCGEPQGSCPFLPAGGFTCRACSHCCAFHPFFPSARRVIKGRLRDLSALPSQEGIEAFRAVRDELREWISGHF